MCTTRAAKKDSTIEFLHDNELGDLRIKIDKRDPVILLTNHHVLKKIGQKFYFVVSMTVKGDRCKVKHNFDKIHRKLQTNLKN